MSDTSDDILGAPYGTYVRWAPDQPRVGRAFEQVSPVHPLARDRVPCPACGHSLGRGRIVLLAVGPGTDPEAQERHAEGRYYTAVAIPVHATCAGVTA